MFSQARGAAVDQGGSDRLALARQLAELTEAP